MPAPVYRFFYQGASEDHWYLAPQECHLSRIVFAPALFLRTTCRPACLDFVSDAARLFNLHPGNFGFPCSFNQPTEGISRTSTPFA